jgi:adenylate cyclase
MSAVVTHADALTGRQFEVLRLAAKGLSNAEIGAALGISGNTVKVHVAEILRSLKVANRTEAVSVYAALLRDNTATGASAKAKVAERIGAPAICVVPFVEQPPCDDYFADGLVEDLILRLSAWRWFPVVASGSSRGFDPKTSTLGAFAEKVGASYAISGTLRRSGSRARISVSVVSARDGRVIWSETFDRNVVDLLATQDEISRLIVARIAPELLELEARQSAQSANADVDAWRLAITGLAHLSRRERDRFPQAVAAFDAAIRADPSFGLAHYGRAHAWYVSMVEQWAVDRAEAQRNFLESTQNAMKFDPANAGSQMMCALAFLYGGNSEAAYAHILQAIAINPAHCLAQGILGQLQLMRGQAVEALASLEEALRLGPRDPGAWLHHVTSAMAHFALEQFGAGVESSRHAITLRPDSALPRVTLIACLENGGDHAAAASMAKAMLDAHPQFRVEPLMRLMTTATEANRVRLHKMLLAAGLPA